MTQFQPIIGLEVHCQLLTATKLFCRCSTTFGSTPNHHTCPVCLGLPGALPVLNRKAVDLGIQLAIAVGARIHPVSYFARKHYFYPDLPKGYQITQYDEPYCTGGEISLEEHDSVPLRRIHLEEDAGKSTHGERESYIDFNRAGVPLLEIVTEPAIRSPEQATAYLKKLHNLVRFLRISDGNMEEGSFRVDVNVSLTPADSRELGTRCEIKNINSFRNVERALGYEIVRQTDVLQSGGTVRQETLLFDPASGKTQSMRSKEDSEDYRYFKDPDLLPLALSEERLEKTKRLIPELPDSIRHRLMQEEGMHRDEAEQLTSDAAVYKYFCEVVELSDGKLSQKQISGWILTELFGKVDRNLWTSGAAPLGADRIAELMRLVGKKEVSGKIAKEVLNRMVETQESAVTIIEQQGLRLVRDAGVVLQTVTAILNQFPEQVRQFSSGKEKVFGFFVGKIMAASKGTLDPELVNELLTGELQARKKTND